MYQSLLFYSRGFGGLNLKFDLKNKNRYYVGKNIQNQGL
jgi:hypothetical protein